MYVPYVVYRPTTGTGTSKRPSEILQANVRRPKWSPLNLDLHGYLSIIVIPRSWTENSHPALFRSVDEAMSALGMESSNVDIIVRRPEGGNMDQPTLRRRLVAARVIPIATVHGGDGMRRAITALLGVFSHSVSQEAVIGTGTELDASHAAGLGTGEATGADYAANRLIASEVMTQQTRGLGDIARRHCG